MNTQPLEALLRRPVELFTATYCVALSVVLVSWPSWFYLPRASSYLIASGIAMFGIYRLNAAMHLLRYRINLFKERKYELATTDIPQDSLRLFLGKGFLWTPKHTQRLYEASRQKTNVSQLSQTSGKFEVHGVEMKEHPVSMNESDRVAHTVVLGTTRVGKTRLAELLIAQDIRAGRAVIVFDPKGDFALLKRVYSESRRAGRLSQFKVFHLGYPNNSHRYNPIGRFSRITEVATRIANQLPAEGDAAAFREFAWRFVNVIARALNALNRTPTYQQIRRYINDIEPLFVEYAQVYMHRNAPAGWAKEIRRRTTLIKDGIRSKSRNKPAVATMEYLQELDIEDAIMEGLLAAYKYDRTYFDKIVSSVGPLMEKVTTGAVAELISPDPNSLDARPMLDWYEVIKANDIVYVGLDSLTDQTVATTIGNSMFADLVSVAGHIYKYGIDTVESGRQPKICLHADEFNELIGEEFVPLLNKAGGAGFQVTAYTQTWSDVEARLGSRPKSGQVAGNFNTMIMLRVREVATAKMLTDQLPVVSIAGLTHVSGASDSSKPDSKVDFESKNEDKLTKKEVPLVATTELCALPHGEAFALLNGGELWKVRFPLLVDSDNDVPNQTEDLLATLVQSQPAPDEISKVIDTTDA